MIPKGNQRAGGRQLATHLMNAYDNEQVEIAEVRGAIAQDLHGAFAEWRAEAGATRCRKYLYSLSLNPDPAQGPLTRDQYLDFIGRTEQKLGLAEQPRAVVFHSKYGRQHCHVVWSRIDTQKMKAVQLSHDHQKLRAVAREFARDHHLRLPPGMEKDHGKDRFAEHAKGIDLAEKQQEERTGVTKAELLSEITGAWKESDSGRTFVAALEHRGYLLARGDRRAYVVVDLYGEIHSVSRYVDGAKSKDVKDRLKDYPIDKLQDAAKAQEFARQRRDGQLQRQREAAPAAEQTHSERAEALKKRQQARRDDLQKQKIALVKQHNQERAALKDLQAAQNASVLAMRQQRQPQGIVAFLSRVTGIGVLVQFGQKLQDKRRAAEHERQTEALRRRHARELADFRRRARALAYVEKREARSLRTAIMRAQNRVLKEREPEQQRIAARSPQLELKPDFNNVAKSRPLFTRETLPKLFNDAAREEPPLADDRQSETARKLKENATDIAGAAPSDPFAEALRRRQAQKEHQQERERQTPKGRSDRDRGR